MNEANLSTLEIVSDVICPWCYIGKRRLARAWQQLDAADSIRIQWQPYELNPTMPVRGVDRESYYTRKFGSAAYAAQLIENVTANARADGLEMNYARIATVPNTIAAHRLIWYAERHGCQDRIVDALFAAYFVDGRDVGDLASLVDIAAESGLDKAEADQFLHSDAGQEIVSAKARAAQAEGIHGVPAFRLNGQLLFTGAQSPETIALSIQRALDRQADRSINAG